MNNPLQHLCFPDYDFRLKKVDSKISIFDELRKKWLVCTPEEWVRQNLIKFLINKYNYPPNLIAIEKGLSLAGRDYRFDALVFDGEFKPLLIIECKAPSIKLSQDTFDQIWTYNYEIKAPYFLITNGVTFIMGKYSKENDIEFFDSPKSFEELV